MHFLKFNFKFFKCFRNAHINKSYLILEEIPILDAHAIEWIIAVT